MKKSILKLLVTPLAILSLVGCNNKKKDVEPAAETPVVVENTTSTFVLVHGAWQAPFVWGTVKTQLEAKGQKVIVVLLPAHGDDNTSAAAVSMDVYRNAVITAIKDVKEKIVLVGHSMGGVVVSSVAEQIPDRISKLIYIGAFVPENGQALLDLASQDKQSQLGASLIPSQDQTTFDVKHENIVSIFCQDASADVQKNVLEKFKVEPAFPFTNKVVLTDANFGKVDKYYIHTTLDHAIGMDLQNQMISAAHIEKVYSLTTGHSPFLSKPEEVTNILMTITK